MLPTVFVSVGGTKKKVPVVIITGILLEGLARTGVAIINVKISADNNIITIKIGFFTLSPSKRLSLG